MQDSGTDFSQSSVDSDGVWNGIAVTTAAPPVADESEKISGKDYAPLEPSGNVASTSRGSPPPAPPGFSLTLVCAEDLEKEPESVAGQVGTAKPPEALELDNKFNALALE